MFHDGMRACVQLNDREFSPWFNRVLALRNLVPGCECERVFPAGVGLDSPLRDAANRLPL